MAKGTDFKTDLHQRLLDPDFVAQYIISALEENDPDFLNQALSDVVKTYGVSGLSKKTGIARQAIYTMTSKKGNPTLQNINKILNAMGLEITVQTKKSAS